MSGQVAADFGCHRLLGLVYQAQHAPSGAKREGAASRERGAPSLPGVEGQAFSLRPTKMNLPLFHSQVSADNACRKGTQ